MKNHIFVVFVNFAILYLGGFAINAYFDYRSSTRINLIENKKVLEASAREDDAKYYHACLSDKYPQQFYPNLLRANQWKDLGLKHQFLPLGAQPNKNLSYCNEGYGFVKYTSDRYGFRNTDSNWDSEVDILLIGDSFIEGACVPEGNHISAVVNSTTSLNALTLGMSSNGPQHYTALLRKFIPITNPNFAVLAFYPNDNIKIFEDDFFLKYSDTEGYESYNVGGIAASGTDFYKEASSIIKSKEVAKSFSQECNVDDDYFLVHNKLAEENKNKYEAFFDFSLFAEWASDDTSGGKFESLFTFEFIRKRLLGHYNSDNISEYEESIELMPFGTKLAVDTMFQMCSETCTPIFMLLPNSNYWREDARANNYLEGIASYIKSNYAEYDYMLVDGRNIISSDDLSSFSPTGPHYSIKGYKQLTSALLEVIENK